jgi:hypothetical protein
MDEPQLLIEPDSVVEAYKKDVDRTLLRENLKLTAEERLRNLMRLQRFAAIFLMPAGTPALPGGGRTILELTAGRSRATLSVMGSANDSTTSSELLDRFDLERDIPTTDEDVQALRRHRAAKPGGAAKRSQGTPLSSSETGICVAANEPELRWKALTCGEEFPLAA